MQNYNLPKMNKEPLKAFEQNIMTIGILKQDFKNMNGSQKWFGSWAGWMFGE